MRTRRTPDARCSSVLHHARNAAAFRSGYASDSLASRRSSDSSEWVAEANCRPNARFIPTYLVRAGASLDEKAVSVIGSWPSLPATVFPAQEGTLHGDLPLRAADTPMCSRQYGDPKYLLSS